MAGLRGVTKDSYMRVMIEAGEMHSMALFSHYALNRSNWHLIPLAVSRSPTLCLALSFVRFSDQRLSLSSFANFTANTEKITKTANTVSPRYCEYSQLTILRSRPQMIHLAAVRLIALRQKTENSDLDIGFDLDPQLLFPRCDCGGSQLKLFMLQGQTARCGYWLGAWHDFNQKSISDFRVKKQINFSFPR